MQKRMSTAYMTYVSLMIALAIILNYFPEIPLAFLAPWLKLDFSFVPMLLVGFSLGPVAAALALAVTNLVHLLSSNTAGVGQLANVLMGLAFLMPPAIAYQKKRTYRVSVVWTVVGVLCMTLMGVVTNKYILVPVMLGEKLASFDMAKYLYASIVPFNLLKGTVNALITFLLYKRLSALFKNAERDCHVSNSNK